MRRPWLTLLASVAWGRIASAATGAPSVTFAPEELFTVVGRIDAALGAPRGHGSIAMHRGSLMIVSADDGRVDGSIQFFDVSNPRKPALVARREDDVTHELRECHGFAFSRHLGRDLVALQSRKGFTIWDITDVAAVERVADVPLPLVDDTDYGPSVWWMTWQGRTLYAGGSNAGLYIVDTTDPKAPVLVDRGGRKNPIPASELGGFRVGPVFAIGNLLVAAGMDQKGLSTLDVSDPHHPKVLWTTKTALPAWYAATVHGDRLYGAGTKEGLVVVDLSNPSRPKLLSSGSGDRGGYVTAQDDLVFMGASSAAGIFDVTAPGAPKLVAKVAEAEPGDKDFATPISNVAFIGDDHGHGTALVPHSTAPDTTPPRVLTVSPTPGATAQRRTSRVGVTFSDSIDLGSVDATSMKLRPKGGAPVSGRYAHAFGIVNFEPDAPLADDTTYEIVLEKGGIKDWSGNALADTWISTFTTGASLPSSDRCRAAPLPPALVGAEITLDAAALASVDGAVSIAWSFGDGAETAPSSARSVSHAYLEPGHYSVLLRVRAGGEEIVCAGVQTVHRALAPRAPTSSSTLAFDAGTDSLWAVNQDHGTVSELRASTGALVREVPVGREPRSVALHPDGGVVVAVEGDDTVVRIGPQGVTRRASMPRGSAPFGVVVTPERALVTLSRTGQLAELTLDLASPRFVDVGPAPRGLGVTSTGKVLVSRFISPDGQGELVELTESLAPRTVIALPHDPGPDTGDSGAGLPNYLGAPGLSRDASWAFVPAKKDNILRGVLHEEPAMTFESTVRPMVAYVDLDASSEDMTRRKDLNDMALSLAAQPTSKGDYVFVANVGSQAVTVLDAYDSQTVSILTDTGAAPIGLALDEPGGRLFVHHFLGRDVAVYDVKGLLASTDFAPRLVARHPTTSSEVLSDTVLRGKKLFYDARDVRISKDGYLACASCHFDGDQDGRTWDFFDRGEGLRNTISLVGRRGTGHGPVHWTANFDEIQDFEGDIRNAFQGKGLMRDEDFERTSDALGAPKAGKSTDLDALAAYVSTLRAFPKSPFRSPDGALTKAATRGAATFARLGCASCHAGSDFTNSAGGLRFDVGTLGFLSGQRRGEAIDGLDTPTLKGLWMSAPYLHDGSAPTLRAVLVDRNPAGRHGDTRGLSEAELSDLEAYLLSLDDTEPEAPRAAGELEGGCQLTDDARAPWEVALALLGLGAAARAHRRRRAA